MTLPTKITVIGAGSASFGESTLSAIMRSKKLRGSTLALVDRNAESLDIVQRLANRLNREWDAQFTISAYTDYQEALSDSKFVVNAIEVGARENLWKKDFEIPIQYGVRQPYAENGGPGGFAHAARNIGPIMQIAHAMEKSCPEAWFVNFTNPMIRICDAVNRHSKIKAVGLCHQIYAGYSMVGVALAKDLGIEVPEGLTGMHAAVDQHPLQHRVREFELGRLNEMASEEATIEGLLDTDSEGALEMIENQVCATTHYHLAANLPNVGQISNLPFGCTVETPVIVDGAGIHPVHVGALPEPIAELCRREVATAQLGVDAAVEGSCEKALQCLLLDPVITDIEIGRKILDDYLTSYKEYLPQFWK